MNSHPALEGHDIPREPVLGPYRLEVLRPGVVDEDFAAVTESVDRLSGFMGGDWPAGLTLEENRDELAWHAVEFELKRSFAWVVRDGAGLYLGCLYVFPRFTGLAADVYLWVRSGDGPAAHEAALASLARDWLAGPDWPAFEVHLHQPEG